MVLEKGGGEKMKGVFQAELSMNTGIDPRADSSVLIEGRSVRLERP